MFYENKLEGMFLVKSEGVWGVGGKRMSFRDKYLFRLVYIEEIILFDLEEVF